MPYFVQSLTNYALLIASITASSSGLYSMSQKWCIAVNVCARACVCGGGACGRVWVGGYGACVCILPGLVINLVFTLCWLLVTVVVTE